VTHTVRLPNGWAKTTLGAVGRWSSGGTPSRSQSEYYGGTIPWVKTGDLDDGLITSVPESITKAGLENSSAKLFPSGTLLMAMYGATIGKLGILGIEAATNQACAALLPNTVTADMIPYVFYYLMAERRALKNSGKGGAQPNISQTVIKAFDVPIAPLIEQHRIVEAIESYLTRLDNAVASLERVQRNLERYRASVLKAAVEGRLVPTEADLARQEGRTYEPADVLLERILAERKTRWIEDAAEKARSKAEAKARKADKPWTPEDDAKALEKAHKAAETKYKEPAAPDLSASGAQAGTTDLPEGWCWATADQLAYRVTDGEHQTPTRTESGIPLVSARNVLNGQLSFADVDFVSRETHLELCKRLAVAAGDVLLSCSGTVGRACVVPPGVEFSMVRSAAVLMPALPIGPYMEFGLRSPMLQEQIRRRKTETAQANIFQGKIKQLVFPLPPFAEQEHITTRTGEYFAIAEHIEKGIKIAMAKCLRLRQSILKWAFEGKLVEQDPDDEPASVLLKRIQSEIPRVKR